MDILWAISNPPAATIDTVNTPLSPRRPGLLGRSSTHYRSSSYDDHELLASPGAGASLVGLPGAGLLSAATGQSFAVPTPPYADGSWEMYQDFVGGVQFWGYALASGSGDGGVRMWDSKSALAIDSAILMRLQCVPAKPTAPLLDIPHLSRVFSSTKTLSSVAVSTRQSGQVARTHLPRLT